MFSNDRQKENPGISMDMIYESNFATRFTWTSLC